MKFIYALKQRARQGYMPVIADLKCRSPKEGNLMGGRDPVAVAKALVSAGAPALSVVTEPQQFGGSLDMLSRIVEESGAPVLRKDFIKTKEAVKESVQAGASALLLIAAILDKKLLFELYSEAKSHGIAALVEAHSMAELEMVNALHAEFVGINNRDITLFETDSGSVDTTAKRISSIKGNPFIVSESAIFTAQDVQTARDTGANAVLVGTALLQAADIAAKYRELSISSTRIAP